jgi:adenylosuccinate lyase
MDSWTKGHDFQELIQQDEEINRRLTTQELAAVFSYDIYQAKVDYIFKRCGLE